jgi:hypothetical protein
MKRAVVVKSARKNRARREAVDATWAWPLRCARFPVWVVRGGSVDHVLDPGYAMRLNCGDDYCAISLKLKTALACLLAYDSGVEYVFVCDDDTFVHPTRFLEHEPSGELEGRLHRPMTDHEMKLNGGRPWVNGGAGFYMSRRLCELYVAEVSERRSCDDVLASRVAQRHGIKIIDRPDLYSDGRYGTPSWRVPDDNQLAITCHPVEPAEMRELYEACNVPSSHNVLS